MSYLRKHIDKAQTPQFAPLTRDQVENRAGGYVYKIDNLSQLRRFLIIGTSGGTYYASEREMTTENLDNIRDILDRSGVEAINMAVEISEAGRAPKNDQAILLVAMASVHKDLNVRKAAFDAVGRVCRIGTHLYQFATFRKLLDGGWGRSMRDTICKWMNGKDASTLAFQVAKYRQRGGWSARDLLRKAHPVAATKEHDAVYKWVVSDGKELSLNTPAVLHACDSVSKISGVTKKEVSDASHLISEYRLPREVLPTQLLSVPDIWEAMLPHMGVTALIRNLGKMTSVGLIKPNSKATVLVSEKLQDEGFIRKGRVHPLNILGGSMVYKAGKGVKGKLSWSPVPAVSSALEMAFYTSFGFVEPTGKRVLLAIDVSGSMGYSDRVMNVPGMTASVVAACMSMVTLRSEGAECYTMGYSSRFKDLGITRNDSLSEVMKKTRDHNFGGTDCAIPMIWASENKIGVDTFVSYTDSETWAGSKHPSVALREYRQMTGLDSKLVACGITATNYSVSDPKDDNSMDIVGFDSSTPAIISSFAEGEI